MGDLADSARSLLNMRSAFEAAYDSAVQGDPLIYGIEVAGEDAALLTLAEGGTVDITITTTDPRHWYTGTGAESLCGRCPLHRPPDRRLGQHRGVCRDRPAGGRCAGHTNRRTQRLATRRLD